MEKSITEFINEDYKSYSLYVLYSRAIPSVIDGLKPVQRMCFYQARKIASKKAQKVVDLSAISSIGYAHGEVSAQDAIIKLARKFDNNIPLLDGIDSFGSRRVPEAAAARYIHAKVNEIVDEIFIHEDMANVNEYSVPEFYLPIIPWILVNGVKGVAIGHATEILPRCPVSIVDVMVGLIDGEEVELDSLSFKFPDFVGKTVPLSHESVMTVGNVEKIKTNAFLITELPIGYSRESYFTVLLELEEKGLIDDFEDRCGEDGFQFMVKMNPKQREKAEGDLIKYLKLSKTFTENITTIDEHGKLRLFDSAIDLMKYFLDFRLNIHQKKLEKSCSELIDRINLLKNKKDFIEYWIERLIDKPTKQELLAFCESRGYDRSLMSTPIFEFSKESLVDIEKEILELSKKLDVISKTDHKKDFKKLLKDLKKKLIVYDNSMCA